MCENSHFDVHHLFSSCIPGFAGLALVFGIVATIFALGKGPAALKNAESWGFKLMIALDLQMLLGLLLYGMLSPFTRQAMQDFGAAMRDSTLRFWAVEHLTMMLGGGGSGARRPRARAEDRPIPARSG